MLKHKIFERQIIKKKIGIKKQKQKQNRHNQLMLPTSERGVPN
jgi:hypothetical protein